jgi:hypothetical protein
MKVMVLLPQVQLTYKDTLSPKLRLLRKTSMRKLQWLLKTLPTRGAMRKTIELIT